MANKPKFGQAPTPPGLTSEQARFIEKGRGKDAQAVEEPTHRLTVDVPKALHLRFKAACSRADKRMAHEIIQFVEKRTKELESGND